MQSNGCEAPMPAMALCDRPMTRPDAAGTQSHFSPDWRWCNRPAERARTRTPSGPASRSLVPETGALMQACFQAADANPHDSRDQPTALASASADCNSRRLSTSRNNDGTGFERVAKGIQKQAQSRNAVTIHPESACWPQHPIQLRPLRRADQVRSADQNAPLS